MERERETDGQRDTQMDEQKRGWDQQRRINDRRTHGRNGSIDGTHPCEWLILYDPRKRVASQRSAVLVAVAARRLFP